ncbi:MAG TPA: fused MFS/spermidine synthase [Bacteroidota bacterium]|jgi:predicted membrane-bound spermidine synthase
MSKKKHGRETARTEPGKRIAASTYLLLAFIEGAAVISVELLGAKMLTPFFGNSLIVWASVIGVTITFLTIGYYAGGLLSRGANPDLYLALAFLSAAALITFMSTWAHTMFGWFQASSVYSASIVSASLLLGPPLFAFGTTSPLVIRQLSRQVAEAGKKAGLVYAVSTVGGIVFTFLAGFVLIPALGITIPLYIIACLLFGFTALFMYSKTVMGTIVAVVFLKALTLAHGGAEPGGALSVPFVSEGLLGQLKVVDKVDTAAKLEIRHLLINGIPQTRIVNNAFRVSYWKYVHEISMFSSLKKGSPHVLLFGFAAGSLATELIRMNMTLDAVELDARMMPIARDYFYFDDTTTRFFVDDARHYIKTASSKYDLIVFDVLNGEVQPSYVFTTESFRELKNLLNDDGMIIIEFQEILARKKTTVYKCIVNTLLEAGYKAYVHLGTGEIVDIIIVSSPKDIDFSRLKKENMNPCCAGQPWTDDLIKNPVLRCPSPFPDGFVLTDDKPVIDYLNAETIRKWREGAIINFAQVELTEGLKLFK